MTRPKPGGDQEHHRNADAADIGLHTEGEAEQVSKQGPQQSADREQRYADFRGLNL